jgi:hypothetical protein
MLRVTFGSKSERRKRSSLPSYCFQRLPSYIDRPPELGQTVASMDPQAERRRYTRVPIDVRVTWVSGQGTTVRGAVGRACDISQGGISVFLPKTLEVGETSELQFKLPTWHEPMRVRVVVRTRDSFRYGFEFLSLSAQQRTILEQLCQTISALA